MPPCPPPTSFRLMTCFMDYSSLGPSPAQRTDLRAPDPGHRRGSNFLLWVFSLSVKQGE